MSEFLKAYSVSEVSKKIDVPVGTLYQWEKDFKGVLHVPRNENNERYFTDFEIEIFKNIKIMREKNLSKAVIRDLLEQKEDLGEESSKLIQPSIPQMQQSEAVEALRNIQRIPDEFRDLFVSMMSEFREELKNEVREEIREELRNELLPEIRKELVNDSEGTQKLLSTSNEEILEKLNNFQEQIKKQEEEKKKEIARHDEFLLQNTQLMRELKKKKEKGFFKRLFG